LLALSVLVMGAPLAVWPGATDAFSLPKLLASQTLGLFSLVLLAPAITAAFAADRALAHRIAWLLLPLLAVPTVGWAFSEHPLHVRQALASLWIGAACLAGWVLALPAARLSSLLRLMAIPAAAMALLAVLQRHGAFQPFQFGAGAHGERLQVTSLAGNPADLAAFLVLPCLVAQVEVTHTRGRRRWLWGGTLALSLYALAVTETLTALVSLGVGSLVLWLLLLPRRRTLRLGVVALAVGLGAMMLLAPLRSRVDRAVRTALRGEVNSLLTGRLDGWRTGAWMVRQHPWAGVGHGAYRAEFVEAKLALALEGAEFYPRHVFPTFANAHNELVEVAAEWGLPGLLALAWALFVLLRMLGGRGRADPEDAGRALAWSGLAALALLSMAHFPFRLALTGYPALLFLAWVVRWSSEHDS
jgi:O-antigen ligase